MSFIGQVTNINQTMYVPAHIIAEHLSSMKFADEFGKIMAREKEEKINDIKDVEKPEKTSENPTKEEQKKYAKDTITHIDLKV